MLLHPVTPLRETWGQCQRPGKDISLARSKLAPCHRASAVIMSKGPARWDSPSRIPAKRLSHSELSRELTERPAKIPKTSHLGWGATTPGDDIMPASASTSIFESTTSGSSALNNVGTRSVVNASMGSLPALPSGGRTLEDQQSAGRSLKSRKPAIGLNAYYLGASTGEEPKLAFRTPAPRALAPAGAPASGCSRPTPHSQPNASSWSVLSRSGDGSAVDHDFCTTSGGEHKLGFLTAPSAISPDQTEETEGM
jgi:hypothetical protein